MSIAVPDKKHFYSHMQGLVGSAFVGQRAHMRPHFDHLDGVKTNNRFDNLELVSVQENNSRRSRSLARKAVLRSPEGIRVAIEGFTRSARHLNLDPTNLQSLVNGRIRTHYGWTRWSDNLTLLSCAGTLLDSDDWRVIGLNKSAVRVEDYLINPFGAIIDQNTGELLTQSLTSPQPGKPAYLRVSLNSRSGRKIIEYVHRIVATTFLPNPSNKPIVDHLNRDSRDNRITNLRWATYKENNRNIRKCPNRIFKSPDGSFVITRERDFVTHCLKAGLDPERMKAVCEGLVEDYLGWRHPTVDELRDYYNAIPDW